LSREIKEGAIFIADAHYPHHGDRLLDILKSLKDKKIQTPQLFLMGDIFDLLFGYNEYIKTFSKEAISLLNRISQEIEIIYIEGNHDFCLKEIFPNIKAYKRTEQPIKYSLNGIDVYLAHGDNHKSNTIIYKIYSTLLRNRVTLTLLKPFDKKIIDHRIAKLKNKKICDYFKEYKSKFDTIIDEYPPKSLIIEGHFHQAIIYKNYVSLPSLACQGEIGIIKMGNIEFLKLH